MTSACHRKKTRSSTVALSLQHPLAPFATTRYWLQRYRVTGVVFLQRQFSRIEAPADTHRGAFCLKPPHVNDTSETWPTDRSEISHGFTTIKIGLVIVSFYCLHVRPRGVPRPFMMLLLAADLGSGPENHCTQTRSAERQWRPKESNSLFLLLVTTSAFCSRAPVLLKRPAPIDTPRPRDWV